MIVSAIFSSALEFVCLYLVLARNIQIYIGALQAFCRNKLFGNFFFSLSCLIIQYARVLCLPGARYYFLYIISELLYIFS